jgi:hypothetical protein
LLLSRVADLHRRRILAAPIFVSLEGAMVFIDDLHDFAHSFLADHQRIGKPLPGQLISTLY